MKNRNIFFERLGKVLEDSSLTRQRMVEWFTRTIVELFPYQICEIFDIEEDHERGRDELSFVRISSSIREPTKSGKTLVFGFEDLVKIVEGDKEQETVKGVLWSYVAELEPELRRPNYPAQNDFPEFRDFVTKKLQDIRIDEIKIDINRYPIIMPSATRNTGFVNDIRQEAMDVQHKHTLPNYLYLIAYETLHEEHLPRRNGIPRLQNMLTIPLLDMNSKTIGRVRFMNKHRGYESGIQFLDFNDQDISFGNICATILSMLFLRLPIMAEEKEKKNLIKVTRPKDFCGMVGKSKYYEDLKENILKVASVPLSVLITGDSGTGKECVAKAIHLLSPQSQDEYICVNASALTETLLESELFGHVQGAFTGATEDKKGLIEAASGGILFLDEIGLMSLTLQAKMLRVLESDEILRVGAHKYTPVNTRFIFATNKNLRKEVQKGTFRNDLYYRVNILNIHCKPLRKRRSDIPILINYLLSIEAEKMNRISVEYISREFQKLLCIRDYSEGNVRDLQSIIQRILVMNPIKTTLNVTELQPAVAEEDYSGLEETENNSILKIQLYDYLAKQELKYVKTLLRITLGNRNKAAKIAGIESSNFYKRIQRIFSQHGEDLSNFILQCERETDHHDSKKEFMN